MSETIEDAPVADAVMPLVWRYLAQERLTVRCAFCGAVPCPAGTAYVVVVTALATKDQVTDHMVAFVICVPCQQAGRMGEVAHRFTERIVAALSGNGIVSRS